MKSFKQELKPISENKNYTNIHEREITSERSLDHSPVLAEDNNLYIELTYYTETMQQIKSYYIMTLSEYEELKSLHMDLYIENFLNDEKLTKDNLDIYVINNKENINILKKFINVFGNPFDILGLINLSKNKIINKSQQNVEKELGELLLKQFSDSNSDSTPENFSEPIFQINKNKNKTKTKIEESDSDSEDYIETMTEIIKTYNKSKTIDDVNLRKLSLKKPDLLNDTIISELYNKNINKS
jgi:hypothetical protein